MTQEQKAKAYDEALERAREELKTCGSENCDAARQIFRFFPQLRESEDEGIRMALCDIVRDMPYMETELRAHGLTAEKTLAYLEKQEQKPVSTEDMPYITDEHFYEREPADSFKYKLAEYMTKCCTKKEGPYGYTYGISAESILKMAEEELLKRGIVQKPAWSEEDERRIDAICELLENTSAIHPNYSRRKLIIWLKSLRPQPKVEWSEQNKKWFDAIIKDYEESLSGDEEHDPAIQIKINLLKSLRPCPSWKPSEVQMHTLEEVINNIKQGIRPYASEIYHLEELLEQLRKL